MGTRSATHEIQTRVELLEKKVLELSETVNIFAAWTRNKKAKAIKKTKLVKKATKKR